MPFIRTITKAIASGVGVGAAFYTLGGVANVIFPTVTGIALGVVGFGCAFAIAIADEVEKK